MLKVILFWIGAAVASVWKWCTNANIMITAVSVWIGIIRSLTAARRRRGEDG